MKRRPVIEILFFDAGGGHRSAMTALSGVLAETHPHWIVKATNLQEILEPIDPIYKVTDKLSTIREVLDEVKPKLNPRLQRVLENVAPRLTFRAMQSDQFYNEMLKRGVSSGLDIMLPIMQRFIRLSSRKIASLLGKHWRQEGHAPDMVVSVIPNFNAVVYRALKRVHPHVPYVTIMTDMVDIPPHFWMEKQDQVIICGTEKAHAQAQKSGFYRPENIHRVSGMILKKYFYQSPAEDAPSLASIGLKDKPGVKTALIMFGGNGSALARDIVDQYNASGLPVQSIVMCGNNRELYESLLEVKNCVPVPFCTDVTPYMRLCDFMVGKPGPGSISEAIHMGKPVLVEGNDATMPQERPNIEWILENGIGETVSHMRRDVVEATQRLIDRIPAYQQNIATMPENRAVYEICAILERTLHVAPKAVNENKPSASSRHRRYTRGLRIAGKKLLRLNRN